MSNKEQGSDIPKDVKDKIDKRIKHDIKQRNKALKDSSPEQGLLQSHILTEYYIDKIISALLPRGDKLVSSNSNSSYSAKLAILDSFDVLSRDLIDSLKNLNSVRNNLSHKLNYELTEEDIDKIGRPLKDEYRNLRNEYLGNLEKLIKETLDCLFTRVSYIVYKVEEGDVRLGDKIDLSEW